MCTPHIPTLWLYLLCGGLRWDMRVVVQFLGSALTKNDCDKDNKGNEREQVQVTELQPGDIVLSSDILTKEPKTTLVTDNQVMLGEYSFVKLIFSHDDLNLQGVYSFIETTEDHVMIIIVKGRHLIDFGV